MAERRGLASTVHYDMKTHEISMKSRQHEAHSFICLISPVFLSQRSVVQVVSKTQGLDYLNKILFKPNTIKFVILPSGRL